MADGYIRIGPSASTWVVRAMGAVLADSDVALELREGAYPAVPYFPRSDVAMQLFERSATTSTCPHKGVATYYSFVGKSGRVKDAAWSYEAPKAGAEAIAGHLAFYPDRVTIERV